MGSVRWTLRSATATQHVATAAQHSSKATQQIAYFVGDRFHTRFRYTDVMV
jgi:hypothetical protein